MPNGWRGRIVLDRGLNQGEGKKRSDVYMGWINKSVWIDDPYDTSLRFLRRIRRKAKIKRIFGYGK